jgi:hypothetical protein
MSVDNGGLAPTFNTGCADSVGGGLSTSTLVPKSIVPLRLLGPSVVEMRFGEWTELYDDEASRPAYLVITVVVFSMASISRSILAHFRYHQDALV